VPELNDDLKKLGYRLRTRVVEPAQRPGRIAFDERGNAIYQWTDNLGEDSEDGERARHRALDHPGLAVVEDEPGINAPIQNNAKGLRLGYNPYESGLLPRRKPSGKKRDLRALSKWIEMKKRVGKGEQD
jgi:hypothetical protein